MVQLRHILIVDDDEALLEALADHLVKEYGFGVTTARTLEEADEAIEREQDRFATVILDIGLPDGDGRDYCAKLRRTGRYMPVIILTGSVEETDVVRGLDSGANDYVAKPFHPRELVARIHSQLRAFHSSDLAVYPIGPYSFQPSKRTLSNSSESRRIRLTEKESEILKLLYRSPAPVDREAILDAVWGCAPTVTTHTLETHIYRLRQKIESNPSDPCLIVTENRGYRLKLD